MSSTFEPVGLAVDENGDIWASEVASRDLYKFNSSCVYTGPEAGPSPLHLKGAVSSADETTTAESIAIQPRSGDFFVTGEETTAARQAFVEVFDSAGDLQPWYTKKFTVAFVAIDQSSEPLEDPSACGVAPLTSNECYVYVSHAYTDQPDPEGDGLPQGIEKFTSSGTPANFVNSKNEPTKLPYINGYEITGTPAGPFSERSPEAVVVDKMGDIFAIDNSQVSEFAPSGQFIRNLSAEHTGGLDGNVEYAGFGGPLTGIAVDPVTGVVAVGVKQPVVGEPSRDVSAIDIFDPVSGALIGQITATEKEVQAGIKELSHLFNVSSLGFGSSGELYATDPVGQAVDAYGHGQFAPSYRLKDVSEKLKTQATLNDEINPEVSLDPEVPSPSVSACQFEYTTEADFKSNGFSGANTAACNPTAASLPGNSWTPVHAQIEGLVSGNTYEYRLAASIPGTLGGESTTEPLAFTAPHSPRIDKTSFSNVTSAFAELSGLVNPLGADTVYHFEYISQAEFETSGYTNAAMTSAVEIGEGGATGSEDVSVARQLDDLIPSETYHFRLIAQNEIEGKTEVTVGPDTTFKTQAAPFSVLPDGRAYELVTPANKGGATDMFAAPPKNGEFLNKDVGYVSEVGESFLFETNSAFGPNPAAVSDKYVFRRNPTAREWTYASLASPSLGVQRISEPVFDPTDFANVAFDDFSGSEASQAGSGVISLLGPSGGPYTTTFVGHEFVSLLNSAIDTIPVGAATDMSTVVLESLDHTIAPGAKTQDEGSHALYEWNGTGECGKESLSCSLIDVTPQGGTFKCGARLGQGGPTGSTHNAMSNDGSMVIFTAPDPGLRFNGTAATVGCWDNGTSNAPQLYMRRAGTTTQISAPMAGVEEDGKAPVQHPAVYVGASEDDSRIFFVTETEETQEVAQLGLHDMELYSYDTTSGQIARVSTGINAAEPASVRTVPTVSADGSVVYFTALGKLTSGLAPLESEQIYLYRYDMDSGTLNYVATINQGDYPSSDVGLWVATGGLPNDVALKNTANWYATPDGSYLLFSSSRNLVDYSSASNDCALPGKQDTRNGHCYELYRYHYESESPSGGSIVCVSCNPSGAPPTSNAEFTRSAPAGPAAGPVRAMSDDGSYAFFDTADSLVSQDGNATLDVYEWHNGRISLLSSGSDSAPSFFLGASPDGANVYIGTHAKLVPQDGDSSGDVYDVRMCTTASPCIKPPPVKTGQCEGDACQNPAPQPIDEGPVSLSFVGAGNFNPAPAVSPKKLKLSRSQELAKALKACRKKPKRKRATCEKNARKRYGTRTKSKKAGSGRSAQHADRSRGAGR
ncbi:MAG TPA: hypothetical protein VFW38_11370 [Solirubrobacteraceae bacterium]|nr:hypothetical protein [Solirubrobacteraceae bacterium]